MLRREWTLVALGSLLLSILACSSDPTTADIPVDDRPPGPGRLTLEPRGYDRFLLQWGAPRGPVDGFLVEARVDVEILPFREYPGGRVTAGELEELIVLDHRVAPELVSLAFRVRSFIGVQTSEPTNSELFETTLWPPADAGVLAVDAGVDISWNPGSRLADRILIDRLSSPDAGVAERSWSVPPAGGELLDGEVAQGAHYWYRFQSGWGDVTSPAIDVEITVE